MVLLCAVVFCLAGCLTTPKDPFSTQASRRELHQDPNLPNIMDPKYRPTLPQAPKQSRGQQPVVLRISRLDLPLKLNLSKALSKTIPAHKQASVTLLKNNGLRMDLLPIDAFEDFSKSLGEPLNVWRSNLQLAYDGTPLNTTPKIKKRVAIDIHDPQLPQTAVFKKGWFRLMFTVNRVQLGYVELGIIPQHHVPKVSVRPRSALDKIWDGTLLDQLQTTIKLPNTHLLIISRTNRPTLAQYRKDNQIDRFDSEPGDDSTHPLNHSPGDLLLTYNHWNHPAQMVFVIARVPVR